ncbi:MAG TPA: competence/damage-inducible protein A [Solirubrobacteraceae bacterium]|nr:competence/damage-inducible protein A [Solirubrobacteraceae bacterium]
MSGPPRAGIVVTGTEVLTGRVKDRNGPWLAERLWELGVDVAYTTIVGDRPEDMEAALRFMGREGIDLILTSGGLGPTADDLTAAVVGRAQGREMVLDEALEERIAEILRPLAKRWPNLDMDAISRSNRKQAVIPEGSTVLEPIGTAPGLVVPPKEPNSAPTVVVLPGPPRELQPMWSEAVKTEALRRAIAGATEYRQVMLRLYGIPESEIAETLRTAEHEGVELRRLEITTCLKRGEVEVVTRYEPGEQEVYDAFEAVVRRRHADTLFSDDGSTVDDQVAGLLRGKDGAATQTIATAESCTGGLLAARLTDPPGASDYVKGGIVVYSNDAKVAQAGVSPELIERHGAVSSEVAIALAEGARTQMGADVGVGVTGIAGPGDGTEEKPVGLVWLSVATAGGEPLTRSVNLPGSRADVRDRTTSVAMHLIRRALLGEA